MIVNNKAGLVALLGLGLAVAGCNSNSGGTTGTTGSDATSGANLDTGAVLAKVGEDSITRGEMFALLEANAGERALQQLIETRLVLNEAKAKGIEVSSEEVEAEIKRRAATNPAVEEAIKGGGARLEELRRQLRYQIALDRLLTSSVQAEPKAVEAWFNGNNPLQPGTKIRALYDRPAGVKIGLLISSQKARADVMAQQLKAGTKTFQQLVDEQKKAKDLFGAQSIASTADAGPGGPPGGFIPMSQLPPGAAPAVAKLQPNQTTGVLTLSKAAAGRPGVFGIVQLLARNPEVKASATDPSVVLDYKLTQVAKDTVKENPGNPKFEETLSRVAQQIAQQNMQQGNFSPPAYRQVIDFINQTRIENLLTSLRPKGTVTVSDPQYTRIADAYKPVPTAAPIAGAPGAGAPAGGAPAGGAPAGGAPAGGAPAGGAPSAAGTTDTGAPAAGAPGSDVPAAGAPADGAAAAPTASAAGAPAGGAAR